jgi:DNA ligase 1
MPLTRTLKPIPNTHVRTLLKELPDGLDGELMIEGATFNQIQSQIMREDGTPKVIYCVFDVIDRDAPYCDRIERLEDTPLPDWCRKILPVEIESEEDLRSYEILCVDGGGYEGVMIRDPEGLYKYGRSTVKQGWLCKLKRFTDAEAVIVGYEELQSNANVATLDERGLTKRSHREEGMIPMNTLGAWIVRTKEGVEFKVSSGMTAADRASFWEDPDSYIGKLVKYKYQEAGALHAPRFPVFLGIRHEDDL